MVVRDDCFEEILKRYLDGTRVLSLPLHNCRFGKGGVLQTESGSQGVNFSSIKDVCVETHYLEPLLHFATHERKCRRQMFPRAPRKGMEWNTVHMSGVAFDNVTLEE